MKKLILIPLALILIISCQGNVSNKAAKPSIPTEPSTHNVKSSEDYKIMLTRLFKQNPYNPNGYQLYEEKYNYRTGNSSWEKDGPLYMITKEFHSELKKYKNATVYLTGDGSWLLSEIVDCRKKGDTCRISRY